MKIAQSSQAKSRKGLSKILRIQNENSEHIYAKWKFNYTNYFYYSSIFNSFSHSNGYLERTLQALNMLSVYTIE